MKKCILLSLCLVPGVAFAGYYSDLETALTWMYLLLFIWGILNIILFFKIWGSTNNIEALKATICDKTQTTDKSNYLKKMYLLNKADDAYNFLNERLTDEIITIYKDCNSRSNAEGYITFGNVSLTVKEMFERRKADVIDSYLPDYALFDKTIPTKLMEVKIEDLQKIG